MKDFNCELLQPLNYIYSLVVNSLHQSIIAHAYENKRMNERLSVLPSCPWVPLFNVASLWKLSGSIIRCQKDECNMAKILYNKHLCISSHNKFAFQTLAVTSWHSTRALVETLQYQLLKVHSQRKIIFVWRPWGSNFNNISRSLLEKTKKIENTLNI